MSNKSNGKAAHDAAPRYRKPGTQFRRRAAIYRRISDDRYGLEKGIDRQLVDCRAIADRKGWDVVDVFTENDVSASRFSKKARVQFQRMLEAIRAGEIDAVVTYDSSRLTRLPEELEVLFDLADKHGLLIEYEMGALDTRTPEGRYFGRMLAAQAAMESDNTSKRLRAMHRHRAMNGRGHGGVRIYGWAADQETPVPEEQDVLRKAAADMLAGASAQSVVTQLTADGIFTTGGKPWETANLTRLLLSPRAVGEREHDGQRYTAVWEPLLTHEDQAALAALIEARKVPRGRPRKQLLSNLLVCGGCGKKMSSSTGRGKYVCPSAPRGCGGCTVRIDEADEEIVRQFWGAWDDRVAAAVKRRNKHDARAEVADYGAQLHALDGKLAGWAKRLADGKVEEAEWEAATGSLREQRREVQHTLDKLNAEQRRAREDVGDIVSWWNDERRTVHERRDKLHGHVEAITVQPGVRNWRECPPVADRLHVKWRR